MWTNLSEAAQFIIQNPMFYVFKIKYMCFYYFKNRVITTIKIIVKTKTATDFQFAKFTVQPIQAILFGGNNLSSSLL